MMRIINWPKWYIYVCVVCGIIFFIYHSESARDIRKRRFERDISSEINGVLLGKYIDHKNHNIRTCVFKNKEDINTFYLHFDRSGLYDYLVEGDLVRKSVGDSCFYVIRRNSCKEFTLKY